MSEPISGAAAHLLQQVLENQGTNQQQAQSSGKRSFDSYMQQQQPTQMQDTGKNIQSETVTKVENPKTSGADMQNKLAEFQKELAESYKQPGKIENKFQNNELINELTTSKSRFGLLKEAYSKIGDTSKVTSDMSGRFTQIENEYKAVENIMSSDKNLSSGEMLALQARLYQVSQHIEVMSKVVDQMAGGIKTVLNTNV